jgi:hypothetical protein
MSGPTMASAQARDEGVTSEPWICEKCNVFVSAPLASKNNKRICPMGHTVEQPMSFLGGAFGVVLFVVAAAAAAHVIGWVWSIPARLLNAFTVGSLPLLVPFGLLKGVARLLRGAPTCRRLLRHDAWQCIAGSNHPHRSSPGLRC